MIERCGWSEVNPLMTEYHDTEWGVPVHDDLKLFEFFTLDAFQAGLSWSTILNKRESFRQAFAGFNPEIVAGFGEKDFVELMNNSGIIRNKLKINATIKNASAFCDVSAKHGSFDSFIWKFTDGKTIHNHWKSLAEIPPKTGVSDIMSKELKSLGFSFVGSTICYSFMQAAGMVNDHLVTCFRHSELICK